MLGHGKVPTLLHRHPIYILSYPLSIHPPTLAGTTNTNPPIVSLILFLFLFFLSRWLGVDEKGRLFFFSFSCHVGDTKSEDDPSMVFF